MRRNKNFTKILFFYLSLIAISTLISFVFDQQVIQKENILRDLNYKINSGRVDIDKYTRLLNSFNKLELSYNYNQQIKKNKLDKLYLELDILNSYRFKDNNNKTVLSEIDVEEFSQITNNYLLYMKKNFENYNEEIDDLIIQFENFKNDDLFAKIFFEQSINILSSLNSYKILESDFKDFNANSYVTSEEIEKMSQADWENENNYKTYSLIREKMDHHIDLTNELTDLYEIFRVQFSNVFIGFFDTLDTFASEKNKKNFYILLSIFFQILALFFLILLFKKIVIYEKK